MMLQKSDDFCIFEAGTNFKFKVKRETLRDMLTRVTTRTDPTESVSHPEFARPVPIQQGELRFIARDATSNKLQRETLRAIETLFPEMHPNPTKAAAMRSCLRGSGPFIVSTDNRQRLYGVADANALRAMIQGLEPKISRRRELWLQIPTQKKTPTEIATKQSLGGGHTKP
ncbi:hypothetical protein [Leucobacter chromiiresistens]|nr:hypothetical protein [Leucobacter chromiiresistens]